MKEERGEENRQIINEEEKFPFNPVPAEYEQDDVVQEDGPAAPEIITEQPYDGQISQPQVRRSTCERKAPQMFSYRSLGQPSYQTQTSCNTVGAYGPPS